MKRILLILFLLPFVGFGQVLPANDYVISSAYATDAYPTFRTLASAINHLNTNGISGNVRFLLDNDQTVTSQLTINAFTNVGNNTVTIKPNTGKDIKITGSNTSGAGVASVFLFNGTSNVIIDGANSLTGNTKNLTLINNDNLNNVRRSVVWIGSNGSTPSSKITVKNSILKFASRNSDTFLLAAIYSGNNQTDGNNSINVAPSTSANSDISIINNETINVREGIYINGNSSSSPSGWKIQGNKIGSSTDAEKPIRGVYISNALNYEISGNIISGIRNVVNNGNDAAAIVLLGTSSGSIIGNTISDIVNTISNNNYYTAGILVRATGTTNINNNFISNVYNSVTYSNNYNYYNIGHGIFVTSGTTTNIYYNTIVMYGGPNGSSYSSCLYTTGGSGINIQNNIFVNTQANTQYALFLEGGTFSTINNNSYYVTNANGNFSNRFGGTTYAGGTGPGGFPGWRTALGNKDAASIIKLPTFVSTTDFHLQNVAGNSVLKAGVPILGITTDIDVQTRSTTTPYMGADEIECSGPTLGSISAPAALCPGGSLNPTAPMVTDNGSAVTSRGWELETAVGVGTYASLTVPYTVAYADNAKRIRYFATNGCGTTYSNLVTLTINANASIGSVTGSASICIGGSATAYTANSVVLGGGTGSWSSTNNAVATVDASGNVTGVSAGTTDITYTITGGCSGTKSAYRSITVNANASIGSVTGLASICIGGSATAYTANSVVLGGGTGSWSSTNNAVATVDASGNVTGVSAGTTDITYTITGGCSGTKSASRSITVNANASIGSVTGLASICIGGSATAYTANSVVLGGGTGSWSSSNNAVATVDASGNVTGVSAGTTDITYTITGGCSGTKSASRSITVNANLTASVSIAASPTGTICSGTSVTFTATATNPGTTPVYQWKVNGSNVGSNSSASTFTTTTLANNDIVTVVMTSNASPCLTGSPATSNAVTMAVNPTPTPTFTTAAQAQTCADTHITYATQSGQSNYVWTVSGVLNTDYRLIARGTSTNHDIVIEWLTAGSKTVTVNYNNSNGCSGASPATYTTNVQVVDRGQVNGGRENLCKGDALPTLTLHSIAGNTIAYPDASLVLKWQYSDNADNSDWQDIAGTAGQISYSPTAFPGAFRTYQVVLQSSNGCTKTSIPSRIRFQAFSPPTNGVVINTSCTGSTGSVVLNGLPTGNWTLYRTGTSTATITGTGASITISNLAAGSYSFTYREGNCTSDPLVVTINRAANTWDGTKWSKTNNTTLPTADDSIVFEGNYTLTSDISACSCTVNSGSVVVNSGITLTITNEVTVNGGSLTFENNASLIQTTNAINSGSIIYKRSSQPMKRYDFTYWSSPVAGQTLYSLSPNTRWDKYLSYTGDVWKEELSSGVMQPGIGYIIRVPEPNVTYPNGEFWSGASYAQTLSFIGRPNNGVITSSQYMEKDKYYLIGNPYPSAIHADAFLYDNVNNRGILGGTVYFWTHNTAIKLVGPKYAYVSDDYASYNLTGGVASAPSDPNHNVSGADNGLKPTGYIGAGQSFFASAESGSGNVEFTNEMRYGGTRNSQFFKPGKTSKSASMEKHRLWLNLTNAGGAFKQTLIGYIEGATNTYDKIFDGLTYDGNSYIDFYSINEASDLTIQGRALPFTDADVVPLGYRSTIAGEFTIAIDQADGSLATQRVYLEDKQTGTISELTAKNYTFTTKAGTFKNRFVLRYKNNTLGTGDFETTEDAVSVLAQNKTVTVNSTAENIEKVFLYDLSGKLLYTRDNVNNLQLIMQNLSFAQQVLLVKVVLDNGYQTTKKVIFK